MRPAARAPGTDRRGFALAVVVFLLFAIGVAGALGYQAVRTDAAVSLTSQQGSRAFTAAQAGLQRFMSEVRDTMLQERTYDVLSARAVVTPRRAFTDPGIFPHHRYIVRSVGIFEDPRFSDRPSRRTIYHLAEHQRVPVELLGALVSPSENITLNDVDRIDGRDQAAPGMCPEARQVNVAGVVGGGSISTGGGGGGGGGGGPLGGIGNQLLGGGGGGGDIHGDPPAVSYPGAQAVMDSLAVDWAILTDPDFPVEHDGTWPNFATMPADSFPTIRRTEGVFNADEGRSGRGLLIVTRTLRLRDDFEWDGLILADEMWSNTNDQGFEIRGGLVVGLDASGDGFAIRNGGDIRFHSCNAVAAGRGLAHLEPLAGTWWEAF